MPSAMISGRKTRDIGTAYDPESPAPHTCDTYATTAQNTPVRVYKRHCGHDRRPPTKGRIGGAGPMGLHGQGGGRAKGLCGVLCVAVALAWSSATKAETRVYLLRGWFGVFSTG